MSFYVNDTSVDSITYNGSQVRGVYYNNKWVWGEDSNLTDPSTTCLTLYCPQQQIYVDDGSHTYYDNYDGTLYYNCLNGEGWQRFNSGTLPSNTIRLRGVGNHFFGRSIVIKPWSGSWASNAELHLIGSLDALLDYQTYDKGRASTLYEYCFSATFENLPIVQLPEFPASSLIRPARCYGDMFRGCQKIKLSTTKTSECNVAFSIPGSVLSSMNDVNNTNYPTFQMFATTSNDIMTPEVGKTYYTNEKIVAL